MRSGPVLMQVINVVGGLRDGCDGTASSEAGVAASGVVAVQPTEQAEAGFAFAGPCPAALESLPFAGRVEGLREHVGRRTAYGAPALGHARLSAGAGERPARALSLPSLVETVTGGVYGAVAIAGSGGRALCWASVA